MKLSKYQENLLKNISSVEKRGKIRKYMKNLINDISRARGLMDNFVWTKNCPFNNAWSIWQSEVKTKLKELIDIEKRLSQLAIKKEEN